MLMRRRVLGSVAGGAGLLAVACGGAGGAGGVGGAAPAKVACAGTLDVVSPWNVGSTTGDGITALGQDFAAAHPGC